MAAVFERYPVGGGEFALALALADNAHDDGTRIYPSVNTMAHKSRQSVRAVQLHLRLMQERGWLLLTKRGGGRGHAAEYRISPDWLKGAELAPFQADEKGAKRGTKRVQNDAPKGAKQSTPYKNRKNLHRTIPPSPPTGARAIEDLQHPADFDRVWSAYPRKADQPKALAAWIVLAPQPELVERMLRAIVRWERTDEWQRERGRFIPRLAKWLDRQGWLDVPTGASSASPVVAAAAPAPLTPEQLARNREMAQEAIGRARNVLRKSAEVST
jgi:hypothetical protein